MSLAQTKTSAFRRWFAGSKVVDSRGKPLVAYHGTTHEFSEFKLDLGNPENHYGRAFYFTSSPEDTGTNYAGEGPDLTQRIELTAEKIFDQRPDTEDLQWGTPQYKRAMDAARQEARKRLSGGAVSILPVYLKILDPVVIDGPLATHFEIEVDDDGNETGSVVKLYEALTSTSYDVDAQALWGTTMEGLDGSDFSAKDFEQSLRLNDNLLDLTTDDGELAVNEFIRDLWRDMGFDGIIMNADVAFGSGRKAGQQMKMPKGTKHYIVFDPRQIKSATGNRGTFDPEDTDIRHNPQGRIFR